MNTQILSNVIDFLNQVEPNSSIQICDEQLRFVFVGNKFCELLNLDKNEILNKNLREINTPLNQLSDEYLKLHIPILQGLTNEIEYITFIKSEGKLFIAENIVRAIKANNGQTIGLYIITKVLEGVDNLSELKKSTKLLKNTDFTVVTKNSSENRPQNMDEFTEVVTFLVMIGKYDKEISIICSRIFQQEYTPSAISKFITRKIFVLFNVDTRKQLVDTLLIGNLVTKIPKIIFNNPTLNKYLFSN